jgi:BirA family biotin operon repressor/biotin-[acetyl-CoA-carboxylase] ligase
MGQGADGASEGTLALADVQTAGRGRLGRQWQSPPGAGLLFSLLFRPRPPITPTQVMMAVAVGVVAGLAEYPGVTARLKWPNDILLHDHKLAGLLGESSLVAGAQAGVDCGKVDAGYVVVGCGLNVNLAAVDLPPAPTGRTPPTSLLVELGRPIARIPLLQAILAEIETHYDALRAGQSPHAEWRALCATLGQGVVVRLGERVIEGIAADVAADGSLVIRQADGKAVVVAAGDVTLRGRE